MAWRRKSLRGRVTAGLEDIMLLDGSVTKQEAINDCLTYWNPNRTLTWFDMGIDIIIGKREGYYFWDMDGKNT